MVSKDINTIIQKTTTTKLLINTMERIEITIPDNLSPQQEIIAIAKQLGKKLLPSGVTQLGNGYEIKHLQTIIKINREPVKQPIVTRVCPICSTIFEQSLGKTLWINYGGSAKKRYCCSANCVDTYLSILPDNRVAKKRSELGKIRIYN